MLRVLALTLLVVALAGCGSGGDADRPAATTSPTSAASSDVSAYADLQEYSRGLQEVCLDALGAQARFLNDVEERVNPLLQQGDVVAGNAELRERLSLVYRRLRRVARQMAAVPAPARFERFGASLQRRRTETDAAIATLLASLRDGGAPEQRAALRRFGRDPGGFRALRFPGALKRGAPSCPQLFQGGSSEGSPQVIVP